jgi:hypothetical protein
VSTQRTATRDSTVQKKVPALQDKPDILARIEAYSHGNSSGEGHNPRRSDAENSSAGISTAGSRLTYRRIWPKGVPR